MSGVAVCLFGNTLCGDILAGCAYPLTVKLGGDRPILDYTKLAQRRLSTMPG